MEFHAAAGEDRTINSLKVNYSRAIIYSSLNSVSMNENIDCWGSRHQSVKEVN